MNIIRSETSDNLKKLKNKRKNINKHIDKIDCSIQFIKTCFDKTYNKEYDSNEKIKSIIDSLNVNILNQ